jgi:transposase
VGRLPLIAAWRDDRGMVATEMEVSTTGLVDTKRRGRTGRRRQWPEALKRRIVAETLEPGSSVSIVARRHDVNPNQVFKWRREMSPGQMPATDESIAMLPLEIVSEQPSDPRPRSRRSGVIEITFGCGTRVCLWGEVSPEMLRQVVELLR